MSTVDLKQFNEEDLKALLDAAKAEVARREAPKFVVGDYHYRLNDTRLEKFVGGSWQPSGYSTIIAKAFATFMVSSRTDWQNLSEICANIAKQQH